MRVFVTGATGFVGSYLVAELIAAGHQVIGLCRSDAGAAALGHSGAEVFRGDINDLDRLYTGAAAADAIIHTAFNHDFANVKQHSEEDRKVIGTLGKALDGSDRRLIITSGTGLIRSGTGGLATETDPHVNSTQFARAASEEAADALIAEGLNVMVMRLPQVHDTRMFGRVTQHILLAKQNGRVAYIGKGKNRLPAVHVTDAAKLYRLALEKGRAGGRYHAVAEEGIALCDIAGAIGTRLQLPVESIPPQKAPEHFGLLATLASIDLAASSAMTRQELGWNPTGPGMLADLRNMEDRQK